jgi:hypothetical protein
MTKGLLVLGLSLVVLGMLIFAKPRVNRLLVVGYIDRSGINVPLGILLVAVGVVCVWLYFREHRRRDRFRPYICPKCENVQPARESSIPVCSNCGIVLEALNGFYERYPERKGDPKT